MALRHHTEGIVRTAPTTTGEATPSSERVAWIASELLLALLLVTASLLVLDRTLLDGFGAKATSNAKSIAVLPLVNTRAKQR